ncbi:MAG: hypothetical protein R3F43_29650 [bacterium]
MATTIVSFLPVFTMSGASAAARLWRSPRRTRSSPPSRWPFRWAPLAAAVFQARAARAGVVAAGPRRGPRPGRGRGLAAGYRWAGTGALRPGRLADAAGGADGRRAPARRAHHQRPGGARGGRRAGEHCCPRPGRRARGQLRRRRGDLVAGCWAACCSSCVCTSPAAVVSRPPVAVLPAAGPPLGSHASLALRTLPHSSCRPPPSRPPSVGG